MFTLTWKCLQTNKNYKVLQTTAKNRSLHSIWSAVSLPLTTGSSELLGNLPHKLGWSFNRAIYDQQSMINERMA